MQRNTQNNQKAERWKSLDDYESEMVTAGEEKENEYGDGNGGSGSRTQYNTLHGRKSSQVYRGEDAEDPYDNSQWPSNSVENPALGSEANRDGEYGDSNSMLEDDDRSVSETGFYDDDTAPREQGDYSDDGSGSLLDDQGDEWKEREKADIDDDSYDMDMDDVSMDEGDDDEYDFEPSDRFQSSSVV